MRIVSVERLASRVPLEEVSQVLDLFFTGFFSSGSVSAFRFIVAIQLTLGT